MNYRGYGLPISEAISEGNVGLMQAVERFEPEKGFRSSPPTPCVDQGGDPGIHPALVVAGEDGHHGQPEEGVLQPAQGPRAKSPSSTMAYMRPGPGGRSSPGGSASPKTDVIYMNRRLGGDATLKRPRSARTAYSGEWQDWLVDESPDQETTLAASEEFDNPPQDALRCAHRAQRARAAHLRDAPARRGKDHARGVGEEFGVSRERVRQIEVRAFEKVQNAVKHRVAAMETPAPLPAH